MTSVSVDVNILKWVDAKYFKKYGEAFHSLELSDELIPKKYQAVMGTTPWKGRVNVKEGDGYSAIYVSWRVAQKFIGGLNQKEGKTYNTPTEVK